MNRRQPRNRQLRNIMIIKAHNRLIARHTYPALMQPGHDARRQNIRRGENPRDFGTRAELMPQLLALLHGNFLRKDKRRVVRHAVFRQGAAIALQAQFNKPSAAEQDAAALKQLQQKTYTPQNRTKDNGRVVVEGVGNLMHHIARCCQPIPGDEIVGFITQGRGISVHRADCDQLAELQSHAPERIVDAVWGESYSAGYSLVVRVEANDRSGLLRDITTILANEKVNVLGVASRSDTRQQLATIDMTIEIYNLQVLGRVLGKLNQVPDVIDARRLHGG